MTASSHSPPGALDTGDGPTVLARLTRLGARAPLAFALAVAMALTAPGGESVLRIRWR